MSYNEENWDLLKDNVKRDSSLKAESFWLRLSAFSRDIFTLPLVWGDWFPQPTRFLHHILWFSLAYLWLSVTMAYPSQWHWTGRTYLCRGELWDLDLESCLGKFKICTAHLPKRNRTLVMGCLIFPQVESLLQENLPSALMIFQWTEGS